MHEIYELVDTRAVNEAFTASSAAERATKQDVDKLNRVLKEAESGIKKHDIKTMMDMDQRFHL